MYKTSLGKKPFLVIEFTKSSAADHIWTMIDEGLYKGLSIGGGALKKVREVLKGTGKTAKRIIVSKWWETSIVDIPSNPDGLFTVIKSYGDAIEDSQIENVRYMESEAVKEFVESVEEFLKGGPGSGVKGHKTMSQKEIGLHNIKVQVANTEKWLDMAIKEGRPQEEIDRLQAKLKGLHEKQNSMLKEN